MVALVKELPYAAVVNDDCTGTVCYNCFTKTQATLNRCSACRVARYCSVTCQRSDWIDHKMECKFFKRTAPAAYPSEIRLAARIVMKIHRGDFGKAFNGRTINDLMDHAEDIKKDPVINAQFQMNIGCLRMFMRGHEMPSNDELLSVFGKIKCNGFGIADNQDDVGSGIYLGLSVHDHSCDADSVVEADGPTLCLYTKPGVEYSKDIRVTYADIYLTRAERCAAIREAHFFECSCSWCSNPDHEGWALSLRSPCCPDSACLLRENAKELSCNKCGQANNKITVDEAREMNDKMRSLVADLNQCDIKLGMAGENGRKNVEIYKCFAKLLSPWNINLAHYCRRLVQMAFCSGKSTVAQNYTSDYIFAFRNYLGEKNLNMAPQYVMAAVYVGVDSKEGQHFLREAYSIAPSSKRTDNSESNTSFERLQHVCAMNLKKIPR